MKGDRTIRIAHVINPVRIDESSDLYIAQPVTFQTMKKAGDFAPKNIEVVLLTAQYPEDHEIIPEYYTLTPDLDRSVLDIGEFTKKRKLPLLQDILDRLKKVRADYYIYTNVDIAVQPCFYNAVHGILTDGFEAFTVNRRTITERYTSVEDIDRMYAENGLRHRGHDCFVFSRQVLEHIDTGVACIGANFIGKVLLLNLIAHSEKFAVFKDLHLTFHIGDQKAWKNSVFSDYDKHNRDQLDILSEKYKKEYPEKDKLFREYLPGLYPRPSYLKRQLVKIKKIIKKMNYSPYRETWE